MLEIVFCLSYIDIAIQLARFNIYKIMLSSYN